MRELRSVHKTNKDTLIYGATNKRTKIVKTRVYRPQQRSIPVELLFRKLETGVFILDFEFTENGNYIFVIEEDGIVEAILNAKVMI